MHVSLPRRSHRVGLSMQYLLWICFGLLAIVPWQNICGQEEPTRSDGENEANSWFSDPDPSTSEQRSDRPAKPRLSNTAKQASDASSSRLIFRSQSAPPEAAPFENAAADDGGFMADDRLTGRSGQAYGAQFRASVIPGPGIGRTHAIFPVELMPYAFADNSLIFGDVRGFSTTNPTNGGYGGNFGGGFRQYLPRFDRILGVNAYYDYDNSSGTLFRGLGFGVESLGALYDLRANAYFPTGISSQQLSLTNTDGTQKFRGNNLLVDQQKLVANALHGFDAEIGVPLPGPIAQRHDVRVFGGGYWFEGNQVNSFGGWKIRAQGNVVPSVALSLQVSNDQQFDTNVVFGASWTFGGYKQEDGERKSQYSRMTTPVLRQYNMVVGLTTEAIKNVTVLDPSTGNPYFFEHVSNTAANPVAGVHDGTFERPFLQLTDAQAVATNGNIIFVHANSSYTGSQVALQSNVRVLGEASTVEHQVNTAFGLLKLPHPTTGTAARPIFANSPGNGVVLASNSEFSGFQINTPTGVGIFGNGVSNVLIRQTDVTGSGGQGVTLNNTSNNNTGTLIAFANPTGGILFQGDKINDPAGNATTFSVTGTTGNVTFTSDPLNNLPLVSGRPQTTPGIINNVIGTGGSALVVQGTVAGSIVDFSGSTVNDTTGNGVLVTNDAGTVRLGDINVQNALGNGVNILNDSGFIFGAGVITVNNSTSDAINIQNLARGGLVQFTAPTTTTNNFGVNVTNRQARGIFLNSNAGNVTFQTPVNIQAAGIVNGAAIDYQGSSGNVTFQNPITIGSPTTTVNGIVTGLNSGGGAGILIGGATDATGAPIFNTGTFSTLVGARTTINNTNGIAIEVTNDRSTVAFNGLVNVGYRGNIGIEVLTNNGPVSFNNTTTITNERQATRPGVDIRGNQNLNAPITFNILNVENAVGPAVAPFGGIGVNIGGSSDADANPASVTFSTLNIGDAGVANGGTGLFVNREGQATGKQITGLTIGAGTIATNAGAAVDIRNSVMRVRLTSVSSAASPTNGITLIDNQSPVAITNQISSPKLDDFMFQVLGTNPATARNGGTIQAAAGSGVFISQTATGPLFQTGDVSLNEMSILRNLGAAGISANGLLQLRVTNSDISSNTQSGIIGVNIPSVAIESSRFFQNGTRNDNLRSDHAISLTATTTLSTTPFVNATNGIYTWRIANNGNNTNSFDATNNSPTLAAGFFASANAGSLVAISNNGLLQTPAQVNTLQTTTPLNLTFFNNNLTVQNSAFVGNNLVLPPAVAGLLVNWTGPERGNVNLNTFTLLGNDHAIEIANSDPTFTTNYSILGNTITGTGGNNAGIFVNNFGPTNLNIASYLNSNGTSTQNNLTFTAPAAGVTLTNDIGINISVLNSTTGANRTSSNITIRDAIINMQAPIPVQGMAILFPILQAPATVNLSNNTITVNGANSPAPVQGEAIYFANIIGPGIVRFQSDLNNNVSVNGQNTVGNGVTVLDWLQYNPLTSSRSGQFLINNFTIQ